MAPRFDITRVRLRNYKSIESCDVELGPLTLLVGPNGSGKSNFLDALQFVADALNTNLENAVQERGGMSSLTYLDSESFSIELDFTLDGVSGSYGFTVIRGPRGLFDVYAERGRLGADVFRPEADSYRLALQQTGGGKNFAAVFRGLAGVRIFHLRPETMVAPWRAADIPELRRDGANVAHVLLALAREDSWAKERIDDYLSVIVPGLEGVFGRPVTSFETLYFRQSFPGEREPREFDAASMSDGTLRAVGVLTALFSGTGVVGIEEPELALHPAAVGVLMDAIRDGADRRQVLVTSHSADLLDVPGIQRSEIVAVRFTDGKTVIGPLGPVGQKALDESKLTAGELLRADYLQPRGDE
jgi:predicted ATPase